MKPNTIVLDLDTYQNLKDFQREVLSGKVVCKTEVTCGYDKTRFFTEDEIISKMSQEINDLNEKLRLEKEKSHERYLAIGRINNSVENSELALKQMSIWEFIKWRKSK